VQPTRSKVEAQQTNTNILIIFNIMIVLEMFFRVCTPCLRPSNNNLCSLLFCGFDVAEIDSGSAEEQHGSFSFRRSFIFMSTCHDIRRHLINYNAMLYVCVGRLLVAYVRIIPVDLDSISPLGNYTVPFSIFKAVSL
jgi:hypothetical protein